MRRYSFWSTLAFAAIGLVSPIANASTESELVSRIEQSRRALEQAESKVSAESVTLGKRLQQLQENVLELRERAESVQRTRDERLLGLDQLEARLEQWQRQSSYQKHILMSFADEFGGHPPGSDKLKEAAAGSIGTLHRSLDRLDRYFDPKWRTTEVITSDGSVLSMAVLAMGPIQVGIDEQHSQGALLNKEAGGRLTFSTPLNQNQLEELKALHQNGHGAITWDPTLGNAAQIAGHDESIMDHVRKGGIWAIPIIFFGFISLVISIAKAIQLLKMPRVNPSLAQHIEKMVHINDERSTQALRKLINTAKGPQRRLIDIAVKTSPSQHRDDLMVASLLECRHKMDRFMEVVATSAAISPLLGLLGTVSGMIATFKMMTIFGSGDASTVSGGISEALVTTELGLIVAIPSLVVSALLTRKIKTYSHKLESFTIKLSEVDFSNLKLADK